MQAPEQDDLWFELKRRIHERRTNRPASDFKRGGWHDCKTRRVHIHHSCAWRAEAQQEADPAATRMNDLARMIEALSKRMETIERIVVTDDRKLSAEIEKLRGA